MHLFSIHSVVKLFERKVLPKLLMLGMWSSSGIFFSHTTSSKLYPRHLVLAHWVRVLNWHSFNACKLVLSLFAQLNLVLVPGVVCCPSVNLETIGLLNGLKTDETVSLWYFHRPKLFPQKYVFAFRHFPVVVTLFFPQPIWLIGSNGNSKISKYIPTPHLSFWLYRSVFWCDGIIFVIYTRLPPQLDFICHAVTCHTQFGWKQKYK